MIPPAAPALHRFPEAEWYNRAEFKVESPEESERRVWQW